jgi:hypothetical protein
MHVKFVRSLNLSASKAWSVPKINTPVGNNTVIHKSRVETVGTHFVCVRVWVCVCVYVCVCVCVALVC